MRPFGASCLNSIGPSNVYKGGGGAFTWFAPISPVCGVLGRLGGRPGPESGTTVRTAAGQEDSGGGGLRAVVAGTAEPRWMYHDLGCPLWPCGPQTFGAAFDADIGGPVFRSR